MNSFITETFLPRGYPSSVTDDYLAYQCWDSLQAFFSSLNGALSTKALLGGFGVGNHDATVYSATLTWYLRDGLAMAGRIIFAYIFGGRIDSFCKSWRLYADIINDLALALEVLSPFYEKHVFFFIVCFSSFLKAIVGVAGVTSRASIAQHQALANNMADLAAKDSSQETMVNIIALICSLNLLYFIESSSIYTHITLFVIFAIFHLWCNYKAVRSLNLKTLNWKRLEIQVDNFKNKQKILKPKEMAEFEPIFQNPFNKKFQLIIKNTVINEVHSSSQSILSGSQTMYGNINDVKSIDSMKIAINLILKKNNELNENNEDIANELVIKLVNNGWDSDCYHLL